MSVGLRLRPEAEADLREAFRWYEERQPGLGDQFILECDRSFALAQENPKLFLEIHHHVRRVLIKRFPYGVFYLVKADEVIVLAVLHQARSPDLWP
jgi:plasmid stabilization system protein ParE